MWVSGLLSGRSGIRRRHAQKGRATENPSAIHPSLPAWGSRARVSAVVLFWLGHELQTRTNTTASRPRRAIPSWIIRTTRMPPRCGASTCSAPSSPLRRPWIRERCRCPFIFRRENGPNLCAGQTLDALNGPDHCAAGLAIRHCAEDGGVVLGGDTGERGERAAGSVDQRASAWGRPWTKSRAVTVQRTWNFSCHPPKGNVGV